MKKFRYWAKRIIPILLALVLVVSDFPKGQLFSIKADEIENDSTDDSGTNDSPLNEVYGLLYTKEAGAVFSAGELITQISGRNFTKVNPGLAFTGYMYNGGYTGPVVVSPVNADAVTYVTSYTSTTFGETATLDYKGQTWHIGSNQYWMYGNQNSTAGVAGKLSSTDFTEAAKELIDRAIIEYSGDSSVIENFGLTNTVVPSNQNIQLSWDQIEGASVYEVYRNNVRIYSGNEQSYSDSSLTPSTEYTYFVFALDSERNVLGTSN